MTTHLEYEITADDYIAKLERFIGKSPVGRNFTWFAYFAIISLAWLSAVLFYIKQGHQNYGYVVSGLFALLLTLLLPSLYRWYQKIFWASVFTQAAIQGLVGRKALALSDEFIEESGDIHTIRAHWRDVQNIECDAQRTWLVLAPLIMIVIPNSTFDSSIARQSFQRDCERSIAAHSRVTEQGGQPGRQAER